ncbi:MAG: EAL domain-containing protein, partial [Candidatus Competibacteraceae bacterium]|nr:EAL domain-containing protein [Candidatus Competibacteraceae bacterium]
MASHEPTVFVVDDDPALIGSLSLLLKASGLRVSTHLSAEAFLDAFQPDQRGCLVLDIRLPCMSGLDLQDTLAARQITLPIIILTGYADVPITARAFRAGAFDVIEKPYEYPKLLQRIREALHIEPAGVKVKELAHLTLASLGEGVITANINGKIEYLNPIAEYLTGWPLKEAWSKSLSEVFKVYDEITREPISPVHFLSESKHDDNHDDEQTLRMVLIDRNGREYAIDETVAPIRNPKGAVLGTVVIFHDATQARATADQLAYQAAHDSLTGLVNRREFERRLHKALVSAQDRNTEHVLLYLDLDRFKQVNDHAGHAAGDQLLCQISDVLANQLRQRDTLARLGGDEFAILLEHCPFERGEQIAQDLFQAVQDYRLVWQNETFSVGVSMGVTRILANNVNAGQVLQLADAACYTAKQQGRNRIHVHREEAERSQRWNWLSYLDRALKEDRLQLFRQSIMALTPDSVGEHYEILLRIQGPADETETVGALLPTNERAQLGPVLNRWMLRDVLRWLVRDPQRTAELYVCSLNLSRHTLQDVEFPEFLSNRLERYGVPADKLCFTFNENAITGDHDQARRLLEAIKAIGCRIAIDSFASTLSGFSYLKRIPVDFLRIDGYLIKDIVDDPMAYAMVKSINEVAHALGIATIAKRVDDPAVMKALEQLGVD